VVLREAFLGIMLTEKEGTLWVGCNKIAELDTTKQEER
jgi:hypothetical protein